MVWKVKFETKENQATRKVKDSVKDYVLAQVNKTTRDQKIKFGRGVQWVTDEEKEDGKTDVHAWIQTIMETCHGVKRPAHLSDEAVEEYGWLVGQWQLAVDRGLVKYGAAIELELRAAYMELRGGESIRDEELGPEIVVPPPELNPAMNQFNRRPPSTLPGT
jgi:hypothetical protein